MFSPFLFGGSPLEQLLVPKCLLLLVDCVQLSRATGLQHIGTFNQWVGAGEELTGSGSSGSWIRTSKYTGSGSYNIVRNPDVFSGVYSGRIRIQIRTFLRDPDPACHISTGSGSSIAHFYRIRIQLVTFLPDPDSASNIYTGSGSSFADFFWI